MIAQNPNLRAVKPLSAHMDKKIRMQGRQRLALEHTVTGNNQLVVQLPFTPDTTENLEVYLDGVRVVGGYTVNKSVVTFSKPQNGTLLFVSDSQLVDTGLKWLEIDPQNLLQSNDFTRTAYGTDRRPDHQVAVYSRPIIITQGGIGFARPSPDNSKLLYSSFYGRYGRDTVTYAILTDAGQLSDYRCVDIRVRDSNYIPTMRIMAVSRFSSPLRVNGTVVDVENTGEWQTYAETNGGVIELPNKTTLDGMTEHHFIIQGKDEEGNWFELDEYFDPGEYELKTTFHPDFVITAQGTGAEFGIANSNRLSVMCKQNTNQDFTITLVTKERVLFEIAIRGRAPEVLPVMGIARTLTNETFTYDKDPLGTNPDVVWTVTNEETSPYGMATTTEFENAKFEDHSVQLKFTGTVTFTDDWYDPIKGARTAKEYNVDRVIDGRFITDEDPANNRVIAPNAIYVLIAQTMLWDSPSVWSDMYVFESLVFTYTNKWSIP